MRQDIRSDRDMDNPDIRNRRRSNISRNTRLRSSSIQARLCQARMLHTASSRISRYPIGSGNSAPAISVYYSLLISDIPIVTAIEDVPMVRAGCHSYLKVLIQVIVHKVFVVVVVALVAITPTKHLQITRLHRYVTVEVHALITRP